jgi:hypothetical protein
MKKLILSELKKIISEKKLVSDAIGYNIGEFLYHTTPTSNLKKIKTDGIKPKDGVAINGKKFHNRLYLATSLIAAYDLSVNFQSYKTDEEYVILKINSNCVNMGYEEDTLFVHGIYLDYPIDSECIVDLIYTDDLLGKFDEDDLEDLYS